MTTRNRLQFSKMLFAGIFVASLALCHPFPEEENKDPNGRFFGGDMLLTPEQRILAETGGDISLAGATIARAPMKNVNVLWLPNNKVVPYNIVPELENIAEATFGLTQALREWEERSCLKFKRRTAEADYIEFFKQSGCWSYVGRQGGGQNISLDDGCWGKGTIVHEIGHAMGFGHEQNRPDRDDFLTIRWENIPNKKKHNFNKYSDSKVDSLNSPYDYKSFMQYSKKSFGINDSVTLDPKKPDIFQLGQRVGFTERDQDQAMTLYRCNGKTTRKAERPKTYTVRGYDVCNFESGMCHYTQDTNDDFDWSGRYGGTPSGYTGPDVDHSTGRMGTYVYIEASVPRKQGDKARLLSKILQESTKPQCLSFFLHMYAENKTMMGDFNVYLKDNQNQEKLLFHKGASQLINDWIEIKLNFIPSGSYQIIFEGIRGKGYQGDVSLDDISFREGVCHIQTTISVRNARHAKCRDIKDREAKYCSQWRDAGYCTSHKREMHKFCKHTCKFC